MRTFLTLLLLCVPAFSQPPTHFVTSHDRVPLYAADYTVKSVQDGMLSDPTTWGGQVPGPDDKVWIPEGITVDLQADWTVLDLLVEGRFDQQGHALNVRTIQVHGLKSHFHQLAGSRIVIRDLPIDTNYDPSQWGHGLLILDGKWTTEESLNPTWIELDQEIVAGEPFKLAGEIPAGWKIGDRIVIPDTRQPRTVDDISPENTHTEIVKLTGFSGGFVTTDLPVQHDHLRWRNQAGLIRGPPICVGNLDVCNITIRSENPDGVRGHVAALRNATYDISNVGFVELGRTTTEPLDNTAFDSSGNVTHVGTNQIARYAGPPHNHHLWGRKTDHDVALEDVFTAPRQWRARNCVTEGSPKWGCAVHGSHFGEVSGCFIFDCAGAGLVTEDSSEFANVLTNNLIVGYRNGSGETSKPQGTTVSSINARDRHSTQGGDHWHNRGGLGLASAMNDFSGTRIYGCFDAIGMAGFATTQLRSVKRPGSPEKGDRLDRRPQFDPNNGQTKVIYPFITPSRDVVAVGCWRGIETWDVGVYPDRPDRQMFPGLALVHCRVPTDLNNHWQTVLDDWKILGDFDQISEGAAETWALNFKDAYRFGITVNDCEFRGYDAGYRLFRDRDRIDFNNCTFECPYANWVAHLWTQQARGLTAVWNDCEFLSVDGRRAFIGGDPRFHVRSNPKFALLNPVSLQLRPWHDSRDLDVYWRQQHQDWEFLQGPPPAGQAYNDLPVGVWTQAELIELRTPLLGDVVPKWGFRSGEFGSWYAAEPEKPTSFERLRELDERLKALEESVGGDD